MSYILAGTLIEQIALLAYLIKAHSSAIRIAKQQVLNQWNVNAFKHESLDHQRSCSV